MAAIAAAWKSVSQVSLAKCWNKLLQQNDHFDEEDDLPLAQFLRQDKDTLATRNAVQLLNFIFPNVMMEFSFEIYNL